jgi:endonuclease/exonuclease/phosphatase family metal-dependent hydrolase
MRLAAFNVENMFRRPVALNAATWSEGRPIIEAYARLEQLLEEPAYTTADKREILRLIDRLGLTRSDESRWVVLRRSRGQLLRRRRDGEVEVVAGGRGDWIGWLELKREALDETATRNTARVIADVDADVLAVIEAEDRTALVRFNRDVLPNGFGAGEQPWSYDHAMLIDGNDDRGIDVGLFSKAEYDIATMRSHVDDRGPDHEPLFSRDCAEYEVTVPGGQPVLVMVNHFKSKGYGRQADNDARRRAQATRVAAIYRARRADGRERVAVMGDLNDTPDSEPLQPLLAGTDLRDVSEHPAFEADARAGTFGTSNDKIDYILLSPALFDLVTAAGVNRSGVWHGPRVRNPWPMLETLTRPEEAASDHAAIWCELDL